MQFMTTTDLRTKTSFLVKMLLQGEEVSLIHRSRRLGRIAPDRSHPKLFDAERVKKIVDTLHLKPTTDLERERHYRYHLLMKYGKNLS